MKKIIDELIPAAVQAVRDCLTTGAMGIDVPKGYNGAIASFGTGLYQNGVLATVAIFKAAKAEEKGDVDKSRLLKAIFQVYRDQKEGIMGDDLFMYLLPLDGHDLNAAKRELINISIALKLSIRTFNLV